MGEQIEKELINKIKNLRKNMNEKKIEKSRKPVLPRSLPDRKIPKNRKNTFSLPARLGSILFFFFFSGKIPRREPPS